MGRKLIPTTKLTLEEVLQQFEQWRALRKPSTPIPESLWEGAVSLCAEHSIYLVSKQLRLDYNHLKKRVGACHPKILRASVSATPSFFELDLKPPPADTECFLEKEDRAGGRIKMHLKGRLSMDPLEMMKAFLGGGR